MPISSPWTCTHITNSSLDNLFVSSMENITTNSSNNYFNQFQDQHKGSPNISQEIYENTKLHWVNKTINETFVTNEPIQDKWGKMLKIKSGLGWNQNWGFFRWNQKLTFDVLLVKLCFSQKQNTLICNVEEERISKFWDFLRCFKI